MDKKLLMDALDKASKPLREANVSYRGMVSVKNINGIMQLSSTSPNFRVRAVCPSGPGEWECSVNAALFSSALKTIPDSEVGISMTDKGLAISGAGAYVSLLKSDYRDPEIAPVDPIRTLCVKKLRPYVSQVVHALGNGKLNPMLRTVCLEFYDDGGFKATALDGHRIAIRKQADKAAKENGHILVFGKELDEALKMFQDGDVEIRIANHAAYMAGGDIEVAVSLLDGDYFMIEKILKQDFCHHFSLDRQELEGALGVVKLISGDVLVDVHGDVARLSAKEPETCGESMVDVKIHTKDAVDIKASFNVEFLTDALRSIKDGTVYVHCKNGISPWCISNGTDAMEFVLPKRRIF